jgi:Domain of unknown function (DUF3596).
MPRGVAVHGKSLRLTFSYKGQRCRESLGLLPTKTNIKFAAGKLAAIRHEIKTGTFNYAAHFPNSERAKEQTNKLKGLGARIGELCKEYQKMKYADLATSSQRRYSVAFDQCLAIIGVDRLMDSLFPEDFMNLRAELLATRAASTANHYMNVFRGFVQFIEKNNTPAMIYWPSCHLRKTAQPSPTRLIWRSFNVQQQPATTIFIETLLRFQYIPASAPASWPHLPGRISISSKVQQLFLAHCPITK